MSELYDDLDVTLPRLIRAACIVVADHERLCRQSFNMLEPRVRGNRVKTWHDLMDLNMLELRNALMHFNDPAG